MDEGGETILKFKFRRIDIELSNDAALAICVWGGVFKMPL
jgi:hypothetical protein